MSTVFALAASLLLLLPSSFIPLSFAQTFGAGGARFPFEETNARSGRTSSSLSRLSPKEIKEGRRILERRPDLQKKGLVPQGTKPQRKPLALLVPSPQEAPLLAEERPQLKRKPRSSSEEGLSPFERHLQRTAPSKISLKIKPFGYDLFREEATSFQASELLPVGPDYLLGPGDELRITVWGKINADHVMSIDRDGKIVLPQLGVLHLAGLSFSEAKSFLKQEFSRYYKASGVKMNVSMGQLRSIQVLVVGKAKRPGSYTLSSFSTLVNALFAAGGPGEVGTMRDIQLRRKGKVIAHFDFYELLLKGDKGKDLRLMPDDVIFIPTVGSRIGITGNVKAPALYESKGKLTLRKLIAMAGGLSAGGYLQQVQVERVSGKVSKVVLDLNLEELREKEEIPLLDGDLVKVFSIDPRITNAVTLKGNVRRPGIYAWREGMRVSELFRDAEIFLPDSFLDFLLIERLVPPDYHKELLSVALEDLLIKGEEAEDILLAPRDTLVVFSRRDLMDEKTVSLSGAVNRPGAYPLSMNMRIRDLLYLAGGTKNYAYLKSAELTRITPMPDGPRIRRLSFDLEKILAGDSGSNILLQENDTLSVQAVPEWALFRTVLISGEVRFPGKYTTKKGEHLSSLIKRAGGFTENAYLKGAQFTRISIQKLQQKQLDDSIDRLEQQLISRSATSIEASLSPEAAAQQKASMEQRKALVAKMRAAKAKGRMALQLAPLSQFREMPSDILLEGEDHLFVPEQPQQIQVIGAVFNQTAFIYEKEKTVSQYLEQAGGMTEDANLKGLYVLKVDGTALSSRQTKGFWRKNLISSQLDPGDTIVVPEKLDKIVWLKEVKDITQVLYQMAVTAGVLIVAF